MKKDRRAPSGSVTRKLDEYRRKRDFTRTDEPRGGGRAGNTALRFVVHKHAASHLHYDFRLERDGVFESWAVPKGPSLDPSVKRLAMEVEAHPLEYGDFEGTIPPGEYGAGTVMLWDLGTYEPAGRKPGESDEQRLRRDSRRGRLSIVLHGERLRGQFALVRTMHGEGKPRWLLMKSGDEEATPGFDITALETASVATGRTMEEIAAEGDRVWRSNRDSGNPSTRKRVPARKADPPARATPTVKAAAVVPMLASIARELPTGDDWIYESKYDGIRILAFVSKDEVVLVSRNGNDKTAQFPEVAEALRRLARPQGRAFVLDGEIVALSENSPARFQELQSRTHTTDARAIAKMRTMTPVAYFIFDILLDGDQSLVAEPWEVRRQLLHRLLSAPKPDVLRLSELLEGSPEHALELAARRGWEGVIAKRSDAPYEMGKRSRNWLKLKVEHQQEFVVGGYTEPRYSREHIGAILLGYYKNGKFVYAGHTGGGFSRASLETMYRRLRPLERKRSPFSPVPRTNERPHWVRPEVVVEVRFNEWTSEGKLRQPIYVGIRDDKEPRDVVREPESGIPESKMARSPGAARRARRTGGGA